MPSIKCGNCRGTHGSVGEVKDCYAKTEWEEQEHANMIAELEAERRVERFFEEGTEAQQAQRFMEDEHERQMAWRDEDMLAGQVLDQMTGSPGRDMASDKQIKYAMDLLGGRVWPDTISEQDLRNMERRQVSKLIDQLKLAPKKQLELDVDPDVGMYVERGTDSIFRFYHGQKSGRVLAKRLMGDGDSYHYQYAGSAQKVMARHKLERMPLEEAKAWGRMTGMCVVCGRRLDVPESVEAGIGPVCANKDW